MVAYSFHKMFIPQVSGGLKRQTIRAHRKRHARPGEAVQLYTAMRTIHCRKILTPDPLCVSVDEIRLEVGQELFEGRQLGTIDAIEINGIPLTEAEIETLAIADGFHPRWHYPPETAFSHIKARWLMGCFWREAHGTGSFEGVLIKWRTK
jgi:hypothetical protein